MNKPLISVIVPVYNVQKYLSDCVESLINQSYNNLEIILVDDGSTDKSSIICDSYKNSYNRIIVLHKKNGGVASARNAGLDCCTGDYISFVDSDDYLAYDFYENIVAQILVYKADIIIGSVQKVSECKQLLTRSNVNLVELSNVTALRKMFDVPATIEMSVWNKVYSRKCIGSCKFDTSLKYPEDVKFNIDVLKKAYTLVVSTSATIFIRERPDSIIHTAIDHKTFVSYMKDIYKCVEILKSIDKIAYYKGIYSIWIRVLNRRERLLSCGNAYELNALRQYSRAHISKLVFNTEIPPKQKLFLFMFSIGIK